MVHGKYNLWYRKTFVIAPFVLLTTWALINYQSWNFFNNVDRNFYEFTLQKKPKLLADINFGNSFSETATEKSNEITKITHEIAKHIKNIAKIEGTKNVGNTIITQYTYFNEDLDVNLLEYNLDKIQKSRRDLSKIIEAFIFAKDNFPKKQNSEKVEQSLISLQDNLNNTVNLFKSSEFFLLSEILWRNTNNTFEENNFNRLIDQIKNVLMWNQIALDTTKEYKQNVILNQLLTERNEIAHLEALLKMLQNTKTIWSDLEKILEGAFLNQPESTIETIINKFENYPDIEIENAFKSMVDEKILMSEFDQVDLKTEVQDQIAPK